MFKQWLHHAAVAASFFAGIPYWQEPRAKAEEARRDQTASAREDAAPAFYPPLAAD